MKLLMQLTCVVLFAISSNVRADEPMEEVIVVGTQFPGPSCDAVCRLGMRYSLAYDYNQDVVTLDDVGHDSGFCDGIGQGTATEEEQDQFNTVSYICIIGTAAGGLVTVGTACVATIVIFAESICSDD